MKLTWFTGTTMRLHVGGRMFVSDPRAAPSAVNAGELVSGADRVFALADDPNLPAVDPAEWRPRKAASALAGEPPEPDILRIGPAAVLIDAPGEPPLVLLAGPEAPRFGRWLNDAAIVLFGDGEALVALGSVLLGVAEPRLLALAADAETPDTVIDELREHLDGTVLVSLEPGLAIEV
jgi:hypothetical protein